MKKFSSIILLLFFMIGFFSCKSESTDPEIPKYDVEYKTSGIVNNISEIKYLNYNGDTLTAKNVAASWSYKWTQKGVSGNKTFLKVTLNNETGFVVLTILSDNKELIRDTLTAYPSGTATLSRGITIP
ncbi:MAG: hypothetical protein NTX22_02010 [Ignavibacteriales bacterium]|nr:hypothetical protein [Ignavibacteriales bacterium]